MLKIRIWSIVMGIGWANILFAAGPQQVAQNVLDQLYAVNGNYTFKKPKISISPDNKKVAAFSPWKNTITVDQKAYDICRGFGRDSLAALAYIIGHELVHAYQTQIKGQQVKTNFLAYDRAYQADVRTEKVADIQGVFNAYLAGYGVLKSMPEVIEKIYLEYGLKGKTLAGYPALDERKASCREVLKIAQQLCDIFDACSYLTAIGQNTLATTGYEYILQYYQGAEIHNNLGLAYALNAQQFWHPQLDKYIYPFEADWNTKLTRIAAARGQEQIEPSLEPLRQAFLDKAAAHFRESARLRPGHLSAHINLICVLNMMGRPVEALKYAELHLLKHTQSKKKRPEQEVEMAEMAVGITYALQPQTAYQTKAGQIFERLSNSGFVLSALYGRQNLQAFRGETDNSPMLEIPLPESFRQLLAQMELGRTSGLERLSLDQSAGIWFAQKNSPGSETMVFSNNQGNLVSLMRFSNRSAADASILPPQEDLATSAYRNVVAIKDGFLLKSTRDQAVLRVDAKGRVREMVKYVEHGKM